MSYRLGRLLVRLGQFPLAKLGYFSLVNLIAGRQVVQELLQDEATAEALAAELHRLVYDHPHRERQLSEFKKVREKLGERGASERAARLAAKLMGDDD
jgi:lipid-A-disaccharide synthase